jgi:SAM-dependent methyltransferase
MIQFHPYNKDKYSQFRNGAVEIVPLVLSLIKPKSILDVGCGNGNWLSVFNSHGINDYLGVDVKPTDSTILLIPEDHFLIHNLEEPLQLGRMFDLVVSLEVAEHLPKKCAEIFIDSLIRHGNVILFSAAIPFQGGENHINEQWPEYWVNLFKAKGYVIIDCIRKHIWENPIVEFWYAQNTFYFVKETYLHQNTLFFKEIDKSHKNPLSLVHPENYLLKAEKSNLKNWTMKPIFAVLPFLIMKSLKFRIKKLFGSGK